MGTLSQADRQKYNDQFLEKLAELLKEDGGSRIELGTTTDPSGVSFNIQIPKGNPKLVDHVSSLAAVVASRIA